MLSHHMSNYRNSKDRRITALVAGLIVWLTVSPLTAVGEATVKGSLIANGEAVELPYVYMWPEKEGFYDSSDPTWHILFVERVLGPREIGKPIWDAAWVQISITETDEFAEQPQLEVYSQSIKISADAGGNISGGTYPEIEIEGLGSDLVSGRVWHAEPQKILDNSIQFDFTFSTPLSDPNAPIGDLLPADGGEPGQAYLKWVEVIHSGDIEILKTIVTSDMAAQLGAVTPEEAREEIEFMQLLTPTDVTIVGGSSDGETALLQIEAVMEGENITGEVTMIRFGDIWMATDFSM